MSMSTSCATMIPHRKGAVAMAKSSSSLLWTWTFEGVAEQVIAAQEAEIAFMNAWLERRGATAADGQARRSGAGHGAH